MAFLRVKLDTIKICVLECGNEGATVIRLSYTITRIITLHSIGMSKIESLVCKVITEQRIITAYSNSVPPHVRNPNIVG